MIPRLSAFLLLRMAALLLAAIGCQAVMPVDTVERTHGSAFSAQTFEVALAPHEEVRPGAIPSNPLAPAPPEPAWSRQVIVGQEAPLSQMPLIGPPGSNPAVQLPHSRGPPMA